MKRITVLLADDHTILREGIRKMLEMEADIEVVAEAKDGRQAVVLTMEHRPDVVLMDIAMPGLNGLEATRQLIKVLPNIRILILTAYNDDAYVRNATESGAKGLILKQTSANDIAKAIRELYKGNTYYSPSVARRISRMNPPLSGLPTAKGNRIAALTSREMEVLQLIAEGKANKETASDLCISIKTVEKHRARLMQKLDIHDTAGLTRYAIAAGIIESSVQVTII